MFVVGQPGGLRAVHDSAARPEVSERELLTPRCAAGGSSPATRTQGTAPAAGSSRWGAAPSNPILSWPRGLSARDLGPEPCSLSGTRVYLMACRQNCSQHRQAEHSLPVGSWRSRLTPVRDGNLQWEDELASPVKKTKPSRGKPPAALPDRRPLSAQGRRTLDMSLECDKCGASTQCQLGCRWTRDLAMRPSWCLGCLAVLAGLCAHTARGCTCLQQCALAGALQCLAVLMTFCACTAQGVSCVQQCTPAGLWAAWRC